MRSHIRSGTIHAMATSSTPGDRIRHARESRGLSVADLAAATKCSVRSVQVWEADASRPRYEQISALAMALGVSADYLLGLPRRAS